MATIRQAVKLVIAAHKHHFPFAIIFVGASGIGKTYNLRLMCEKNSLFMSYLNICSMVDGGDLIGCLYYDMESKTTKYATMEWLSSLMKANGGILVADEPNRGERPVHNTVRQLFEQKKIGPHVLPAHTTIVGLMNPDDSEKQHFTEAMDQAMISRCVFLKIRTTPDEVIALAMDSSYDPRVLDLMVACKDHMELDEDFTLPQKPLDFRAFGQLNAFMPVLNELPDLADEVAMSCLGPNGSKIYLDLDAIKALPDVKKFYEDPESIEIESIKSLYVTQFIYKVIMFLGQIEKDKSGNPVKDKSGEFVRLIKPGDVKAQKMFTTLAAGLNETNVAYLVERVENFPYLLDFIETGNNARVAKLREMAMKVAELGNLDAKKSKKA